MATTNNFDQNQLQNQHAANSQARVTRNLPENCGKQKLSAPTTLLQPTALPSPRHRRNWITKKI